MYNTPLLIRALLLLSCLLFSSYSNSIDLKDKLKALKVPQELQRLYCTCENDYERAIVLGNCSHVFKEKSSKNVPTWFSSELKKQLKSHDGFMRMNCIKTIGQLKNKRCYTILLAHAYKNAFKHRPDWAMNIRAEILKVLLKAPDSECKKALPIIVKTEAKTKLIRNEQFPLFLKLIREHGSRCQISTIQSLQDFTNKLLQNEKDKMTISELNKISKDLIHTMNSIKGR